MNQTTLSPSDVPLTETPVSDSFTKVQDSYTETITETAVNGTLTKVHNNTQNVTDSPMFDTFTANIDTSTSIEEYNGLCDYGWISYRQFCYKVGLYSKLRNEEKCCFFFARRKCIYPNELGPEHPPKSLQEYSDCWNFKKLVKSYLFAHVGTL